MDNKTIVAPMTPTGVSAVAALRVSGSSVREVIEFLFGEKNPKNRLATLAIAKNKMTGDVIDSLLYLFFEGPNSYTGEDVLELYPHGNPLIVKELLDVIRSVKNVRLALPGEFTRRAFLNGKMDLIQAESVADVIHSANRSELKNAHKLLGGVLSKKVKLLYDTVMDISSRLELDVDFTEEEADPDYKTWEDKLFKIKFQIEKILCSFKSKAHVSKIPLAVLYGAPNAGKSSLVNALLGEDRLLVSEIPGTTRDFIEVRLLLPEGEIRLVDTAGLAQTPQNELDARSMEKSREILNEADLKIHVLDGLLTDENEVLKSQKEHALTVITKSDISKNKLLQAENVIHLSSKTGEGLSLLMQKLNALLFEKRNEVEELWITSEREKDALENALLGVDRALKQLQENPQVELIAFEMQTVRRALMTVTGEISTEDVLQSIFAGFCIGK